MRRRAELDRRRELADRRADGAWSGVKTDAAGCVELLNLTDNALACDRSAKPEGAVVRHLHRREQDPMGRCRA